MLYFRWMSLIRWQREREELEREEGIKTSEKAILEKKVIAHSQTILLLLPVIRLFLSSRLTLRFADLYS
jgi:hypothetical protein